jgi:ABC-2 type transport system ATP-binding protein
VTIILTTHYIDEAEEIADRVGVINHGEIVLVEEKVELMRKLGRKQLTLDLQEPLAAVPASLQPYRMELGAEGAQLIYTYDANVADTRIPALLAELDRSGIRLKDLKTTQSSLEDIFVTLVKGSP